MQEPVEIAALEPLLAPPAVTPAESAPFRIVAMSLLR